MILLFFNLLFVVVGCLCLERPVTPSHQYSQCFDFFTEEDFTLPLCKLMDSSFCFDVCLFDLILYIPSTIFQLNRDGSSWVEPVLSYDECVLLKDHNAVQR